MILDLHRQGLSVAAIARRTGRDPKTVRKYIERGLEPPVYGPRPVGRPGKLLPFAEFIRERLTAFPDLTATRLLREIRERGYGGAYTAVKRMVAAIRPGDGPKPYEIRFETPPGLQAQVDFARFVVRFEDEPGSTRIIWLFSLVLGHSRFIFARFVLHQDLQTLLRCHMAAFEALGGVPVEILYDRMKTAVTGEDGEGHIIYNRSLLALAQHYGFLPKACRPYRAKTKGKVERPFRHIREDFFLGRAFRKMEDMNRQLQDWLTTVANVRLHGTTNRIVSEAFAAEQPDLQSLPAGAVDLLVTILTSTRRFDAALLLTDADRLKPGQLRQLAEVSADSHPDKAIPVLRVLAETAVGQGIGGRYDEPLRFIDLVLKHTRGAAAEDAQRWLRTLSFEHARKRNFIAGLANRLRS